MYKLYWAPGSGAMAPQALFEEIGVAYEKIIIDFEKEEHRSEEFLAVNPLGQIPALILPDGTLMTESAAMMIQICDLHPEAGLAPASGSAKRADFLRWLFFLAANVYPAVLRFYYAERYSTSSAPREVCRDTPCALTTQSPVRIAISGPRFSECEMGDIMVNAARVLHSKVNRAG